MFDSAFFIALLVILITICGIILRTNGRRPPNFPPGPPRWPLVGNSLQIFPNGRINGVKLSKKYGPILGVQFGAYWAVMLNNAELIREFLGRSEFSGRYGYNAFFEENISPNTKGIVMSQGKRWMELRRFSMRTLRDFGLGKRSLESIIQEEIQELLEEFRTKYVGKPISPNCIFNASVLNIIWSVVAGDRFKLGDEKLTELINAVFQVFNAPTSGGLRRLNSMFPAVVDFRQKFNLNFDNIQSQFREKFNTFLKNTIDQHRETFQPSSPRDFIDAFLEEYSNLENKFHFDKQDDQDAELIAVLMDLFGAVQKRCGWEGKLRVKYSQLGWSPREGKLGVEYSQLGWSFNGKDEQTRNLMRSETTSSTLNWAFYLLALHPSVQEELYREINSVVGNRQVQLDDRVKLPLAEAVMNETYRVSSLAAFGVPHSALEDVQIKGYTIPKNTLIIGNHYSAHYSEETWGDPQNFRPQRFLSPDGKSFIRHPDVMAFSVGKRQCLGESLARDEFFLFLTNLVQQMKIEMPADEPPHTLEPVIGLVLMPEPHRLLLSDRNV